MAKIAFLTMDAESFFDTSCIKKRNVVPDERFDCSEQIKVFADVLKERGVVGTFFVVTDFIPYCEKYLRYALESGNEIALHAKEHIEPSKMDPEEFSKEISEAISRLSQVFGVAPKGYRAPCFAADEEVINRIKKAGFSYDASKTTQNDKRDKPSKLGDVIYKDGDFYEFTLNKEKLLGADFIVSGGGYLRISPFFVTKRRLKRIIERGGEYVLYVHPFELYEGKLPKLKGLLPHERFFINFGRKKYKKRIEYIIDTLKKSGYEFMTMNEFVEKNK